MSNISEINTIEELKRIQEEARDKIRKIKEELRKKRTDVVVIAKTLTSANQSVLDAQKAYEEKGFFVEIDIDEKTGLIKKWKLRNRRPKTQMVGGILRSTSKITQFTPDDLAIIMSKLPDVFSANDIKKALIDSNIGERKLQPGLGKILSGEYDHRGIEKVPGTNQGPGVRYRKVK